MIGAAQAWPIQGRGAFTAPRRRPRAAYRVRPRANPTGTRPAAGDSGGDVPPGGASETRVHAERHPGSGGEGGRGSDAEAGGGLELKVEAEIGDGPSLRPSPKLGAGPSLRPRPNLPEDSRRGARGTAAPPCTWDALGASHVEGGPRASPSLAGDPAALRRPGGGPRLFLLQLRQVWSRSCMCSPPPIPPSRRGSTPKFKPWRKSERPWRLNGHSSRAS